MWALLTQILVLPYVTTMIAVVCECSFKQLAVPIPHDEAGVAFIGCQRQRPAAASRPGQQTYAPTGRSATDFTVVRRRNGLLLLLRVRAAEIVQVFGRRQSRINPRARATGVGKAPRQEIAVGSSVAVRRALWGFSRGAGLEEVGEKRLRRPVCCKPRMIALG